MDEGTPLPEDSSCPQPVYWKEPINGKTDFFTEEVYHQLAGPEPSLEERAMQLMDVLGYDPLPHPVTAVSTLSCKRKHEESQAAVSKRLSWAAVSHPPVLSTGLSVSLEQQQTLESLQQEEPAACSVNGSIRDESSLYHSSEPGLSADGSVCVSSKDVPEVYHQGKPASAVTQSNKDNLMDHPVSTAKRSSKDEPSLHAQRGSVPDAEMKVCSAEPVKTSLSVSSSKEIKPTCFSQDFQQNSMAASKKRKSFVPLVTSDCPLQVEEVQAAEEKKDNAACNLEGLPASPEPGVSATDVELHSDPLSPASTAPSVSSPNKSSVFSVSFASDQDGVNDYVGSYPEVQRSTKTFPKRRPPPPLARKSSLKHGQHMRYLDLFQKYMKRFLSGFTQPPTEKELQDLKEFEKLQLMVAKEQEECQAYLKQLALHDPFLYTKLPPHVIKYTQEKEQGNWRRAENYSRYYNNHSQLPLTLTSPLTSPPPALLLVKTLVQVGSKCRLYTPDLSPNPNAKGKRTVPTDIQKISFRFPAVHSPSQHTHSSTAWSHETASKDHNMESLVRKYHCHIATSASVLQQLLDNHAPDFGTSWDIPVVVKEIGEGAASQKVVFLDKPLLPAGLNQGQRQAQYLQKAVQAFLCQPHNDKVSSRARAAQGQKGQAQGHTQGHKGQVLEARSSCSFDGSVDNDDDDDPFSATVSMDDLETFGSSSKICSQTGRKESVSCWKPLEKRTSVEVARMQTSTEADGKGTKWPAISESVSLSKGTSQECRGEQKGDSSFNHGSELNMDTENAGDSKPWVNAEVTSSSSVPQPSPSPALSTTVQSALTPTFQPPAPTLMATSQSQPTSTSATTDHMQTSQHYLRSTPSTSAVLGDTGSDSEEDGLVIALPEGMETGEDKPKPSSNKQRGDKPRVCGDVELPPAQLQAPPAPADSCMQAAERSSTGEDAMTGRATCSSAQKVYVSNSSQLPDATPPPAPSSPPVLTPSTTDYPSSPVPASSSTLPLTPTPILKPSLSFSPASPTPEPASMLAHTSATALTHSSILSPSSPTPEPTSTLTYTPAAALRPGVQSATEPPPASGCGAKDGVLRKDAGDAVQRMEGHAESATGGRARGGGKPGTKKLPLSTPLDSILKEMMPSGDSTSLQFQEEDPSRYSQPTGVGEHVGYHLWNLSGVSLLVRCNNHSFTRDQRQQQRCVYIRAKPERQTHYGLEQVTLTESVRAWLGCYLRPNSYLLRVRVNMQDQEIVHVDQLTLDKILPATLNFSPPCAFAVLQNIFTKLMQLPAGSYLLSHQAGASHAQLKVSTDTKRGGHDLRCHYMGLGVMKQSDKTVPWVPVDPTLMLPHHWRQGLIPATFQPPDFDHKKKKQQRQFTGPKKKKQKNQNKKKKQS